MELRSLIPCFFRLTMHEWFACSRSLRHLETNSFQGTIYGFLSYINLMFLATLVNHIHVSFFSNLLQTYIRVTQSFIYKVPSPPPGCWQCFHYFAFLLMFWAKIAARSAIGTNPSSFLHFVSLAANQFWKVQ